MSWYREPGWTELIFAGLFIAFYILYVLRIIRIGKAMNSSYNTIFLKLGLRTLIFALLIIALLGPSYGNTRQEIQSVGKDIMICVDVSKSMDATDIQPTRLEKVKFELNRIVSAFSADRIGLIIFTTEAFTQCPLTYDQGALHLFVETLNTNLIQSSGTDFGPPLELALEKLADDDSPLRNKSKIILLISDGEDFGGATSEAVEEIDEKGIRLFTLGIGTQEGGTIRAGSGVKRDNSNNVVISKLNSDGLKDLARKTDGQYYEINETRNDVSRLIDTITKIQGEVRDMRVVDTSANKYYYFLGLAVILLLIDVLTNVRTVRI